MDVYLHLGAHRTGTTAFQAFLGANRAQLAAAGVAVWLPEDLRRGPLAALSARPGLRRSVIEDRRLEWRLDAALDRLVAQGARRLVLSEENLIGTMASCHAAGLPYPEVWGRLRRLDGLFGGRVRRVALGCRDPAEWWASTLAFRLPRGGPVPDAGLLARLAAQPRGWAAVLADIAAALPGRPMAAWDFGWAAGRPDRVLVALLGAPAPAGLLATGQGRNAAPSVAALRGILRARGVTTLPPGIPERGDGPWMPFTREARAALAARHAAELAVLRRTLPALEFAGSTGETPGAPAWKEGPTHDRQDRSLARARREGAA